MFTEDLRHYSGLPTQGDVCIKQLVRCEYIKLSAQRKTELN